MNDGKKDCKTNHFQLCLFHLFFFLLLFFSFKVKIMILVNLSPQQLKFVLEVKRFKISVNHEFRMFHTLTEQHASSVIKVHENQVRPASDDRLVPLNPTMFFSMSQYRDFMHFFLFFYCCSHMINSALFCIVH